MSAISGAEAMVRGLRAAGLCQIYGLVGGKLGPLLREIDRAGDMNFIGTRHEAAAGYMAAAYFARHGTMAVVLAELGPGASNVVPAIASAYNNRLPLLLITSNAQHAASYPERGMFMEADLCALLRPVVRSTAAVHDVRRIGELLRTAIRAARSGRPGPVHLDVPQDMFSAMLDPRAPEFQAPPQAFLGRPPAPDPEALREAAAALAGAERPVLIGGGGLAVARGEEAFRLLARRLDAAVVTTQRGLGALASDDPRAIGQGGVIGGPAVLRALREADLVVSFGCRFSSWMWDAKGPLVRPPQRLIQIDTDPMMLGAAGPVQPGILADARMTAEMLDQQVSALVPLPRHRTWCDGLRAEYLAYLAALETGDGPGPMHPAALAAAISRAIPPGALCTLDGGHTSFWSNDRAIAEGPRQIFHEPGMAQLGFGLPYAIALKLAEPERVVVNLCGDGAFGFTAMELDTARRYRAAVISVIHNNASWGVIALSQTRQNFSLGTDLGGTDYAALAQGLGCFGAIVERVGDFAAAFAAARASGLPALLDCRTRFVPHPMMPAFGATNQLGMGEG